MLLKTMSERNMHIKTILSMLVFVVTFAASAHVHAGEEGYFSTKITPEEQAVFAFFRAAEEAPDYEYWVTSKLEYQALPKQKKDDYLVKEIMRLGHGYGMYDLDTDLLEIKVNVVSSYVAAKDDEPAYIQYRFMNIDDGATPTFNYRFGMGFISMIIDRLDFFSKVELTPEKDAILREKIPYEDDEFDTELEIHVRVSNANYKDFKEVDGIKQWIMMSEIAYIKCEVDSYYTRQTYILWDYVAPWHEDAFRIQNMPEEEKYPHPYDLFKD